MPKKLGVTLRLLIGTSLGRCVKDIADDKVKLEEVALIVSGTYCPRLEQLHKVLEDYRAHPMNAGYDTSAHKLETITDIGTWLFDSGKLFQPRLSGSSALGWTHKNRTWLEIVPTLESQVPAVVEAYEQYRFLADLTR